MARPIHQGARERGSGDLRTLRRSPESSVTQGEPGSGATSEAPRFEGPSTGPTGSPSGGRGVTGFGNSALVLCEQPASSSATDRTANGIVILKERMGTTAEKRTAFRREAEGRPSLSDNC
jgi:hypothetical protein